MRKKPEAPSPLPSPGIPGEGDRGAGAVELAVTFAAVTILLLVEMALSDALKLISHPLWLDECLTQVIANDPSFSHAMTALRGGVDTNPPLLYLLLRPLKVLLGTLGPVELRTFSALFMILALVGVYAICRRFFDYAASWVALLALAAHPAIVEQTWEARGYGIWLAAVVWFCYCLFSLDTKATIAACVLAVVATTVHWFGIISIAMITATDLLMRRELRRRRLVPLLCGLIALLACSPFFIGQRSGLEIPTWLEPISLTQIRLVFDQLFGVIAVMIVLLLCWLWRLSGDRQIDGSITTDLAPLAPLAPLSSLLLMPLLLVVFSYLVQPVMLTRYAIVATLPMAACAGWLASMMSTPRGRVVRTVLLVALIAIGLTEVNARQRFTGGADAVIGRCLSNATRVVEDHGPLPVVFLRRHELYPAVALRPDLAPSMAQLAFDTPLQGELAPRFRYEQQMGRRVRKFYPQYNIVEFSQLQNMKRFFVVVPIEAGADLNSFLPNARMRQQSPDLYEVMLSEK